MADGGVLLGLPRAQAMEMAAQTLIGTARMLLEKGKHPGQIKGHGLLARRHDH